jgi:hypothetical protein
LARDGYCVRRVGHRDGRQSHWIFSANGEIHRYALNLLKRYGFYTQQPYTYSLLDHHPSPKLRRLGWVRPIDPRQYFWFIDPGAVPDARAVGVVDPGVHGQDDV